MSPSRISSNRSTNRTNQPTSTERSHNSSPTRTAPTGRTDAFSTDSSNRTTAPQNTRGAIRRDLGTTASNTTSASSGPARMRAVRHKTIRQGSKGTEVLRLQNSLTQLGYTPGTADADFGRKTKAAVQSFQRDAGLDPDGVAGPKTWSAIDKQLAAQHTTPGTTTPGTTTPGAATPDNPTTTPGATAPDTTGTTTPDSPQDIPPFDAPANTIRAGATGDDVVALQERLSQLGYKPGENNGTFNDSTREAVTKFQRTAGLDDDGVVGPKTWEALEKGEATAPKPLPPFEAPGTMLRKGGAGEDVQALQERLKQFGFDPGEINGTFNDKTDAAVRNFQFAAGLDADGIVGDKTWTALEKGRDAIVNQIVDVGDLGPVTVTTGYVRGRPRQIQLVNVDGKQLEVDTARAYLQMKQAAARDGVNIELISGFRSNEKQQYLYNGWKRRLPGFNPAARPGYSNHQSGVAIDINALGPTRARGSGKVYNWMAQNAGQYGFKRIPSERWHWEYQPGLAKYRNS